MSISSIFAAPTVGQVGVTTQLSLEGTLQGQARWFLRARPIGSTQGLDAALVAPEFTPDVAGVYTVGVKDVTTTTPAPRWDGDATAAPTDDEATAPEVQLVYWVAETLSRPINAARGTATLSLSTYDDKVDDTRPELVTLAAAQGVTIGPDTLADPYLVALLGELRAELELSTYLGPSIDFLDALWRGLFLHIGILTSPVHGEPDATLTSSGGLSTLAACQARLTALASQLSTHVQIAFPVHNAASAPIALSTPIGTTLAEACAYAAALDRAFTSHASFFFLGITTVHDGVMQDRHEGLWREPPHDLGSLCAFAEELGSRLAAHKGRGPDPLAVHAVSTFPGTSSQIFPSPFAAGMSHQACFAAIGQMVDAFSSHVSSFTGDTPAGAHTVKRVPPPLTRPGDPVGAARAVEALALALQDHALDAAAHAGFPAMGWSYARVGPKGEGERWPYTLRLSARLSALLGSTTPPTPENRNAAATLWKTFGGWV